jgi:H+/Na+-translocating ferredoxin:NAD+ oxidoreductase subunit G
MNRWEGTGVQYKEKIFASLSLCLYGYKFQKSMRKVSQLWFVFVLCFFCSSSAFAQTTVYLKPADALKLIFKDSKEVIREEHPLTDAQKSEAKKMLGYDLPKNQYTFYLGRTDSRVDGYALIDEEVGKVLPITFITRINPEGKVEAVEIMVYRESHGGEVASKRFLNQFRQKGFNDEIRLHGNIVNVTGATLSSHALVVGVNRALVLWQILYGK